MKYILPFLSIIICLSCGKTEDINSLRITGSNTHYNQFSSAGKDGYFLPQKSAVNILDTAGLSNLVMNRIALDSLELENVTGNRDTILIQTKNAIRAYFRLSGRLVENAQPKLNICHKIAWTKKHLIVASGQPGCSQADSTTLSVFLLTDSSRLVFRSSLLTAPPADLKTSNGMVFLAEENGNVKVFRLSDAGILTPQNEYPDAGAKEIRIFPENSRVLVRRTNGIAQYALDNGNSLRLLSVINQNP